MEKWIVNIASLDCRRVPTGVNVPGHHPNLGYHGSYHGYTSRIDLYIIYIIIWDDHPFTLRAAFSEALHCSLKNLELVFLHE